MSDTITTADGRTVSMSELREKAKAANEHRAMFGVVDRETCLALVDEIRRLRERVAELESGLVDADNTFDACIDIIESVIHEDAAPLVATKMREPGGRTHERNAMSDDIRFAVVAGWILGMASSIILSRFAEWLKGGRS